MEVANPVLPSLKTNFTKLQIIKNLVVLSLAFLLSCTSGDGLQMLQSTLNRNKGIGVASISIQFALGVVTALFLMKYCLVKFGSKNIIMYCLLANTPSIAANFFPIWEIMIPCYIIFGVSATLLWGSNSLYLNALSRLYALLDTNDSSEIKSVKKDAEERFLRDNITSSRNKCKFADIPELPVELKSFRYNGFMNDNNELNDKEKIITETSINSDFKNTDDMKLEKTHTHKQAENEVFLDKPQNKATELKCSEFIPYDISNGKNKKDSLNVFLVKSLDKACNELSDNRSSDNERLPLSQQIPTAEKMCPQSIIMESITARFFGFHSMLYQSGHIWSNIVSFYVLQQGVLNEIFMNDSSCMCGSNFCNIESVCFENNLKEPSKELKYILISIFILLNILTVILVWLFLDPLETKITSVTYSLDFALATFKQLKRPKQLLLVPLSMYMGMGQGFFYADFSKAFVGCAWGIHHIGLVTIFYGIMCSIMSTFSAWLVKYLGRRTIFLMAAAVNLSVNVIGLLWKPDSSQSFMFFVIAGMWGFLMASFWSQLKAFHGVLFKDNEEAAFGCYELSHCIGACLSFAYSNYLCIYVKIYVLIFVSTIGMIGYLIVEKYHALDKKK